MNNSLNDKLQSLINEGLSLEDAASCLGLDVDSVKMALNANDIKSELDNTDDVTELIKISKPKALRALVKIGLDSKIENVSARVAALRSIAEYEDISTDVNQNKINEIFRKMHEVSKKYDEELAASKVAKNATVVIVNENKTVSLSTVDKNKISEIKNAEENLIAI